jgi:uncharacterized protein YegJ (DUF2314 family)
MGMIRTLVVVCGLVACKGSEPSPQPENKKDSVSASKVGTLVNPGTLKLAKVETELAVVVAAGEDVAALEKRAREKGPKLEITRATLPELFSADGLTFLTRELSPTEAERVKASAGVIVVRGSGANGLELTRELSSVARDLADAAHGWVLDPETFQLYAAAAFHARVPGARPDARNLIVIHTITGDNEQPYLDTAGMRRFGFPDLYFADAASGHTNQIGHLINATAQVLLDGGDVNERGEIALDFHKLGWATDVVGEGTGKAVWKARWAKPRDAHDDEELIVELVPPAGEGAEGAVKLIKECFGAEEDKITKLAGDDPELLAAAAKARADLEKQRPHFAKGIPVNERLTIKAKFVGDDGAVEWMWVDVFAFKGATFEGNLANEPHFIPTLRNGQKVKVKLADIGDYLHAASDGKVAGGYSIELMRKRGLIE